MLTELSNSLKFDKKLYDVFVSVSEHHLVRTFSENNLSSIAWNKVPHHFFWRREWKNFIFIQQNTANREHGTMSNKFDPQQSMANARHEFGEHGGVNMSIEASTTFTVMTPDLMPEIFAGQLGPNDGGCFFAVNWTLGGDWFLGNCLGASKEPRLASSARCRDRDGCLEHCILTNTLDSPECGWLFGTRFSKRVHRMDS